LEGSVIILSAIGNTQRKHPILARANLNDIRIVKKRLVCKRGLFKA
jgi:hypothetical protein